MNPYQTPATSADPRILLVTNTNRTLAVAGAIVGVLTVIGSIAYMALQYARGLTPTTSLGVFVYGALALLGLFGISFAIMCHGASTQKRRLAFWGFVSGNTLMGLLLVMYFVLV